MQTDRVRQSKLVKLHLQTMDHLLEVQSNEEQLNWGPDLELLYSKAFFMGLVAGVVLEKRRNDLPRQVCEIAENFVRKVPGLMQSAGNYAQISALLAELDRNIQS